MPGAALRGGPMLDCGRAVPLASLSVTFIDSLQADAGVDQDVGDVGKERRATSMTVITMLTPMITG